MGYATPIPSQSQFDRYYTSLSKYDSSSAGTGNGLVPWDDARLHELAQLLASFVDTDKAHVVDIGCAGGGLLRHLAAAGFPHVTGVDPSATSVARASLQAVPSGVRLNVCQGTLTALPAEVSGASLYVLSHVLEHVRDASSALGAIRREATDASILYVEVPDAMGFQESATFPLLEFNAEHINYFSEASLCTCLGQNGWTVLRSGRRGVNNGGATPYPCAWALAQPASGREVPPALDSALQEALRSYARSGREALDEIDQFCQRVMSEWEELLFWGTGQTCAILLANTELGHARIRMFTDNDARFVGHTIRGVPVVSPHGFSDTPDLPIIIGSVLHQEAIAESIRAHGLVNPIIRLSPP